MIFFKSIFLSFTLWVLTALLNSLLSGAWLALFSNEFNYWPSVFLVAFIFTLIFSIPGMFIIWVILLLNWKEDLLFRLLLKTGLIISVLSAPALYIFNADLLNGQQLFLSLCIVMATITSIMMHHSIIKSISNKLKNQSNVFS